ncbi:MAG: choice-of-anchor Q domain-containing protein, partial [Pseudomonadota bacterium]
ANLYGGGVYSKAVDLSLNSSTVSGNISEYKGGGLFIEESDIYGGSSEITNSIVTGNEAIGDSNTNDIGIVTDVGAGGALTTSRSNIFGQDVVAGSDPSDQLGVGAAEVFADTAVIPGGTVLAGVLGDNGGSTQTIALLGDPANPALGNADPMFAQFTDQRGFLRDAAAPDIGAFELGGMPPLPPFPELAEHVPVPASEINGVDPALLVGNGVDALTVAFVDETAGKQSSLGWYKIADDGSIFDVELLFADVSEPVLMPGDQASLGFVDSGQAFDFFLLADGFGLNEAIRDQGTGLNGMLTLVERGTEDSGDIDGNRPLKLAIDNPDGSLEILDGSVFHAAAPPTLNVGDNTQSLSGRNADGHLQIGFEDIARKPGNSDDDFNDVVFEFLRMTDDAGSGVGFDAEIV